MSSWATTNKRLTELFSKEKNIKCSKILFRQCINKEVKDAAIISDVNKANP